MASTVPQSLEHLGHNPFRLASFLTLSKLRSPRRISTTVPLTLHVLKPILAPLCSDGPVSASESLAKGRDGYVCTYTEQVRIASYLTSL